MVEMPLTYRPSSGRLYRLRALQAQKDKESEMSGRGCALHGKRNFFQSNKQRDRYIRQHQRSVRFYTSGLSITNR